MYAQLGTITFQGLKGFESFSSKKEAVYAEHALIEGKPRLQRNGSKLDQITLTFSLHAKFAKVETEIGLLEAYVQNGDVVPFVLGNGQYLGDFVIIAIGQEVIQTDRNGNLICADIDITLTEYVEPNKLGTRDRNARDAGFAREQNLPTPAPIYAQPQFSSADLSRMFTMTVVESNRVDRELQSGIQNGSERDRKFQSALKAMKRMENNIASLNQKLMQLASIPETVANIQSKSERVLLAIEATRSYTEAEDIDDLIESNKDLQRATREMRQAGTTIDNATATRRVLV